LLDGYRLQVINDGRQPLQPGNDWLARSPGLAAALAGIPCRSTIIDAELCLPGVGGVIGWLPLAADPAVPHQVLWASARPPHAM